MISELLELNYMGEILALIQWNTSHSFSEIAPFIRIEAFATDQTVHFMGVIIIKWIRELAPFLTNQIEREEDRSVEAELYLW